MEKLTKRDKELIEEARRLMAERFRQGAHHVSAALRTRQGRVFAAVHLETHLGRAAVCAEAVALGMAATAGDTDVETIVAVDRQGHVLSPCGMCRELICDYSPACRVIVPDGQREVVVRASDLLPRKYQRRWSEPGQTGKHAKKPQRRPKKS